MQTKKDVNWTHYAVNTVVLISAVICFFLKFANFKSLFKVKSSCVYLLLIFTVILVQSIKALRLFLVFYGQEFPLKEHLSIYCKVTAVNIVFPFKIGDLFRVYCYGEKLNNYYVALAGILLDRAVDTIAILVFIVLECWCTGKLINRVFYWLFLFFTVISLIYIMIPRLYAFWNRYFLNQKTSAHRLFCLKILNQLKVTYDKIKSIIDGRGTILILLSLLAWAIEFGNVIFLTKFMETLETNIPFYSYLSGAITNLQPEFSSSLVFVTIVALAIIYTSLKIIKFFKEGKL